MPISFNGNSPQSITFNGNQVDYVYYNGDLVWQSFIPLTYTYTGNSSERTIISNGHEYKIITLTSNGTLTFNRQTTVDIWACGGGSNGVNASSFGSYYGSGPGGGGAYCNEVDNQSVTTLSVTIGPANTASGTVITGDASLTAAGVSNNRSGGTGGGGCIIIRTSNGSNVTCNPGSGDGNSKYPFGDSTNFDPHCAGGGGGTIMISNSNYIKGGTGGTNGGSGGAKGSETSAEQSGGAGGNKGGGTGGRPNGWFATPTNGGNGSFYGSGGGGPSYNYSSSATSNPGSGYQGVCYIKIPIEEF